MSCVSGGTVSATSPASSIAMAARHVRCIDPQDVRASVGSMNLAPVSGASIGPGAKTWDLGTIVTVWHPERAVRAIAGWH